LRGSRFKDIFNFFARHENVFVFQGYCEDLQRKTFEIEEEELKVITEYGEYI
jgi:hypothetical protein